MRNKKDLKRRIEEVIRMNDKLLIKDILGSSFPRKCPKNLARDFILLYQVVKLLNHIYPNHLRKKKKVEMIIKN